MNMKKVKEFILVTFYIVCVVILAIGALDKTIPKCFIVIYIILLLLSGVCLIYDIVKKPKKWKKEEE